MLNLQIELWEKGVQNVVHTLSLTDDGKDKDYIDGELVELSLRFVVAKKDLTRALLGLLGRVDDGKKRTALRLVLD